MSFALAIDLNDNTTAMEEDNIATGSDDQYTHYDIVIIAIPFFGVISNGLLLLAIFKDPLKCFRNSATYFVINLSVSDCLTCLFSPIYYITLLNLVSLRYETFKLFVQLCECASILSLTTIAIDRFLIIVYPIKHRIFMRGKIVITWIMAIWLASCAVSVSIKFFSWMKEGKGIYTFCAFTILLSTVVYASTYHMLKKQSRNIAGQSSNDTRAQQMRILKEKKFLRTIIIIACIAVICVLPSMMFFQTSALLDLNGRKLSTIIVTKTFLCIFCINFAVNPLIYVLRLPNYRKTFYLLYCKR